MWTCSTAANSYSGFFAASQAFDAGKLGTQRVGCYAMVGQAPTNLFHHPAGCHISRAEASETRASVREGFVGLFYFGKLDFQVVTQHGSDNAWFGAGFGHRPPWSEQRPGATLPTGSRAPTWNGAFVETHYVYSPQLDLHSAFGVDANVAAGDSRLRLPISETLTITRSDTATIPL